MRIAGVSVSQLAGMSPRELRVFADSIEAHEWPRDADGLVIPCSHWIGRPRTKWDTYPHELRAKLAVPDEDINPKPLPTQKARAPRAANFTTNYAIAWGKARGWKLIEREGYNHLTKRHHDCEFGMDAIFEDAQGNRIGVQGAGRNERAEHWQRFADRAAKREAAARKMRFFYVVFVRHSSTPVEVEEWAVPVGGFPKLTLPDMSHADAMRFLEGA